MATNATFNGNSLQTFTSTTNNGIILQQVHHAGKSNKQAQSYAMSHGNRSIIPYVEFPNKPITLIGEIVGTSIADCDNQIDIFNSLLLPQNANLIFDYNGGSLNRQYTGTFTNVDVQRPEGLYHATFSATFTATTPFGQDTTTTSLINTTGVTTASAQYSFSVYGTAPFQTPYITVTLTTVGGSPASGTIIIGNDATGQSIVVTRTWTSGDVLVIDCGLTTNTPVTVNNNAVNFSGAFPDFTGQNATGTATAGKLDYSDTFSSRTYSITATYYKQWV